MRLHRHIAILIVLLGLTLYAAGEAPKNDEVMTLVQVSLQQLWHTTGAPPFEMKVKGKVYGYPKGPLDIEYETRWSSPDNWFDQISFSGFVQRRLAEGEKLWLQRNAPYEPLRAAQLHRMLDLLALHPPANATPKGVEDHGKGADRVRCAKLATPQDSYRLCFDEKGLLVREERSSIFVYPNSDFGTATKQSQPPVKTTYEFSDYVETGGRSYPKKLRVLEDEKPVVEAEVTAFAVKPEIASQKIEPPKDIEPQAWCSDPSPAYILHMTTYLPRAATLVGGYSTQGRIVVSGVVAADGTLQNRTITLRSTRGLDEAIEEALREWKFQPAMCGQQAIGQDMFLDIQVEPRSGLEGEGGGAVPR